MTKKEANAKMRAKYGADWFDRSGVKAERNALLGGGKPRKATRPQLNEERRRATDGQERYPDYVEDALEDSYEM
jgi:hypothetical protein